ncbi:hypothetical protein HXX76_004465 [Chlamydomonas incerta]|uniref:protein-L-isoaspartate(D-aspartate) O-methyltransferase n=1 Tax=Chlamydomonas incerta TaxID=51695 RepID=A0A835TMD3_CHLIN|nr:hypothetical protein HXX76_004465 [Chlamydomonas incerta]|eukprot:KAG2440360.1 hypothetical protein HXX76_004465 [Chlamydomonas incerta]
MRQIDRRDFTTTHLGIPAHVSYSDSLLPIGQGQSIPAPSLHATCLELMDGHARPGALALDVGSGSGFITACLSLMVGAEGRVVAVERYERLLEQSGFALARTVATRVGTAEPSPTGGHAPLRPELQAGRRLVRIHNIELLLGNALEEPVLAAAAAGRQFDLVHVGAAVREPPAALLALLRPGGRMVVAVGPPAAMQSLTVVDKGPDGATTQTVVRDVRLPPLAPPFADRPL